MQRLETFKLLNILGLALDLLGLIVLAEFVATSERLKKFVVLWIAGAVLWGITVIPIGAWLGALAYSEGPSSAKAANFFINLFGYALLPLGLLDYAVFNPIQPMSKDQTARTRRFGFLLLASGTIIQLVAAHHDLYA